MSFEKPHDILFLTKEEAERIRNVVKERFKKCSQLTGHAREPRDSKSAISQATGASLMADMGSMALSQFKESKMPALTVGQPYQPCITPWNGLQSMKLSELRLETHHRRCHLAIKRVSPVVTHATRSWTIVQDEAGDTERLEIVLHKTRHSKEVLESALSFILREPYFTLTEEGEPTLRVDHPSDIIVLYERENPQPQSHSPVEPEEAASSYKQKGNAALQQGNLPLAHHYYTTALDLLTATSSPNPTLTRDLHRNRAYVNLLIGHFTAAKSDALSALIPQPAENNVQAAELNGKVYFRAATAAYNLRQFEDAQDFFEKQLALMPANKAAASNLARTKARLREQREGVYDFAAIRASLAGGKTKGEVDATSFVSYTEVRESPGKGRGLFTVKNVAVGEVILCEKAFCVAWRVQTAVTCDVRDDRIRVAAVGLERAVVERLMGNPSEIGMVMDLFGDWDGGAASGLQKTVDGPVVDVFRIHDIVARNAFGLGQDTGNAGLWVRAAYINHSCIPNAEREFIGDLMVVRAVRDIAAGEEIVLSYDESGDYDARQRSLLTTWGFECGCALCAAEKGDEVSVREKRKRLTKEADDFIKTVPRTAQRLAILKARRLAKAIDETYEAERFKGLPHLASRGIRQWLAKGTS
ncbi:hypothetical protein N657DRAFT_649890 [Parathielavia appendiculata]|uniref:SET domain-containing protein n=1 Tax=Parathielavia appendiculata TaxID=2587402 RepID=A0AAN6TSN7_9PEZI|nr:hypothetical protein N657DRAFT_649890 [Parathielavia appendiculata]